MTEIILEEEKNGDLFLIVKENNRVGSNRFSKVRLSYEDRQDFKKIGKILMKMGKQILEYDSIYNYDEKDYNELSWILNVLSCWFRL